MTSSDQPYKLFIADDSVATRRHFVGFIEHKNDVSSSIQVVEGDGYEDGLLRFASHLMPAFRGGLLTDYHLGARTGLQLALDLRALAQAALKDPHYFLPVVLMTQGGRLPADDQRRAESFNITVLPKPGPQDLDGFFVKLKSFLKII